MTVFFISAITLADNLLAFCLHSLPSAVMVVVVLDEFSHIVMLLFTIVPPLISFSLHHLMQNRSEAFTIDLMRRLSEERERFSDLSMIDPLTGLYNRRGLHNRLEGLLGAGCHYLLLDIDHFKAYNDNYFAICRGLKLLISADVVRGKKMTAVKPIVVVDNDTLVTSRTPDDLPAFNRESLRILNKP